MAPSCYLFHLLQLTLIITMLLPVNADEDSDVNLRVKTVKGKRLCTRGWQCSRWSQYCCNQTISDYFQAQDFENLFSKRNAPPAQAVGFWDYKSFITAAAVYQPDGFGTTGGKPMGMKEVAAFLAHVAAQTSCGPGVSIEEPLAWGLCFKAELSPCNRYCDESFKLTHPCAPNAFYYGRGALPIWGNYNYGETGEALKVDLLNHPEYLEQNATLAFQAAIWRWMTSLQRRHPSPHEAFTGKWKPTKKDTLEKRVPGFGTTMNILYGDHVCAQGDIDSMNSIIAHYLHYLDLMGIDREEAGPPEELSCAEQKVFNPSSSSTLS